MAKPLQYFRLVSSRTSTSLMISKSSITKTTAIATFSSSSVVTRPQPASSLTEEVKSKYYIPRSQRNGLIDSIYEIDTLYDQRIKRRRRIDPTRELNYTPDHWERHKSVYRRLRHMVTTLGSSPFQRLLFPDLFVSSIVACSLTYYNEFIAMDVASQIMIDGKGVAAGTTAIALLTGFRLNASYGRYNEGRRIMGVVNTASRDLAANSLMWISSTHEKKRMLNLVKAFSVALTFHLNKKGCHHVIRRNDRNFEQQIYAEYEAEMKDIFYYDRHSHNDPSENAELDADFVKVCKWFQQHQNVPLGITSLMRQIIANNRLQDAPLNLELDSNVHKLVSSLGGCERIQKTPIPTCFTRHASRLLFVWSNLMPFAIYGACGPFFTLPSTIAISYSLMGIEDIGVQLEEPFNILPLRQYSDGVYDGVDFISSAYSSTIDSKENSPGSKET